MTHDLQRACHASLERSRTRRAAAAARRLAVLRRRRRRGGSASFAVLGALLALGGPLALARTSAQAPAPAILSTGATGDAVKALQATLGVSQTGTFGPLTRRAVRRFQRSHGLTVDGAVGPQTAAALGLPSAIATSAQPRAATASSATPGSGGTPGEPPAGAQDTLARIADCESGGDPTAISPDGRYRGKYQFTRSTWKQVGGTGDPAAAPEPEQDRLAAVLLAEKGTAPWPVCGQGLAGS